MKPSILFIAAFAVAALFGVPSADAGEASTPVDHLVDCTDSFWQLSPACNIPAEPVPLPDVPVRTCFVIDGNTLCDTIPNDWDFLEPLRLSQVSDHYHNHDAPGSSFHVH